MLVKFFKRGGTDDDRRTLGGGAVKNYLLGTTDAPREKARVLLGDPDEVTEIINGLPFAKVYTSGCLSFHEKDELTEAQKFEIIEDFEAMMFAGLEYHQYTIYWVEHTDKGRVELNFVFPNVELVSGNHLQVYYHHRDLNLVNSWKDLTNDKYGFINPADLDNRRDVSPSIAPNIVKDWETSDKQSIIDKLKRFTEVEDIKTQLTDLVLTQSELRRGQGNPLKGQDDIAGMLEEYGFEISRKGKDSISIKNPDPTKKNIKLKGVIYERDVTESIIQHIAERKAADRTADQVPADARAEQLRKAKSTFPSELEKRRERHYQRYDENLRAARAVSKEQSKLKRQQSKAASKLAESDLSDPRERQADVTGGIGTNEPTQGTGGRRLSEHPNPSERTGPSTASNNDERDSNHATALSTSTTNPTPTNGRESSSGHREHRGESTTEQGTHWANGSQQTEPRISNGHDTRGIVTTDGDFGSDESQPVQGLARNQEHGGTKSKRSKLTQPTNQSHTTSISSPSPYRYPGGIWWWYQYHAQKSQRRRVSEERIWLSDFIYQPKPVLPLQLETSSHATHYHPTTHYRELKRAVKRFAQPSEPDAQSTQAAATADNRRDGTKTSGIDVAQLVSTVVSAPRTTNRDEDATAQSANQKLLERIGQATDRRDSNTEKRTRRISTLAKQDTTSLEQIGEYTTSRRQRNRKVNQGLTNIDQDVAGINETEQHRTARIRKFNQRARNAKNGYDTNASEFKNTAAGFEHIVGAVSALAKALIELFKKLFNGIKQQAYGYASEGLLYHQKPDGSKGKQATTQEARDFIDNHPYDLSGYAQLRFTVHTWDKQKKEKAHEPKFTSFGR